MPFDPTAYGIEIATVLATGGSMPLVASATPTEEQRRMVQACAAADPLVLAGLWMVATGIAAVVRPAVVVAHAQPA